MEEKKVEELVELKENVDEAKDLAETIDPSKPNYILAGLGFLLGFGILFLLTKKVVKKIKEWRASRKEAREIKKARKDAKKHPEDYVTAEEDEIEVNDEPKTSET